MKSCEIPDRIETTAHTQGVRRIYHEEHSSQSYSTPQCGAKIGLACLNGMVFEFACQDILSAKCLGSTDSRDDFLSYGCTVSDMFEPHTGP